MTTEKLGGAESGIYSSKEIRRNESLGQIARIGELRVSLLRRTQPHA